MSLLTLAVPGALYRMLLFLIPPSSPLAHPHPHTTHPPTGLVVIIALLGYGLVEIPRIFWRRSFPEARLKWHYHRVGRAADKLTDASDELERVLAIVLATSQQIPRAEEQLRRFMDMIIRWVWCGRRYRGVGRYRGAVVGGRS